MGTRCAPGGGTMLAVTSPASLRSSRLAEPAASVMPTRQRVQRRGRAARAVVADEDLGHAPGHDHHDGARAPPPPPPPPPLVAPAPRGARGAPPPPSPFARAPRRPGGARFDLPKALSW